MAKELLSIGQRKKIFVLMRELGLDNKELHELVKEMLCRDHISALTMAEARVLIDELAFRAGYVRYLDRPEEGPIVFASDPQLYKISKLGAELGWANNPARLRGFLRKYAGTEYLNWLTVGKAWKVIEGLKMMLSRQEALAK